MRSQKAAKFLLFFSTGHRRRYENFIRFDKLENYSCAGTVRLAFSFARRSLPFVRLRKVEKSFLPSHLFPPLPVFLFVIGKQPKGKSLRVKRKMNLSTFLLLCTARLEPKRWWREKSFSLLYF